MEILTLNILLHYLIRHFYFLTHIFHSQKYTIHIMYDILQLNDMLVPELKELAEKLSIKGYKRLNKQDLIYKILDQQAISGEQEPEKKPKSKDKAENADKPKKKKESAPKKAKAQDKRKQSKNQIMKMVGRL